ncbi:LLM class flavin-dependent oxidoreductase [Nocardioides anomalus]|uniref:LLM class flavin-dependent oxidoreductase n=1 Tax=Nocardioides anomalus TaxID=2712223 RepID=A0A6G6WC40_9ACTN|nr:LLM class flavin-dependent oxidoreductase [Nocardioides anomalus]QIG42898.1 LLM class flavin-dependent oxidoreductase [Nocardioides anomalus]
MARRIRFNAFAMNTVGHQSPGLWRHPEDRSEHYTDLEHWTELARVLERGVFDGVFLADVLGTYDLYGGDSAASLRAAAQVPINDPMMLVPAMALVTEHLGFGVTANTSAEHPYPFARRMSTLDHLTRGRVGWNVVTGYLDSAARNMGATQLEHDERYDQAEEYLEVTRKLWELSWEDDAVVRDRVSGVFAEPAKVHPIGHHGHWFDVPGFHLSEPSPQRTPVVYQAGASPRGLAFAARHAEAIFVGGSSPESLRAVVGRARQALHDAGRDPDGVRIYTKLTIITAATSQEAHAKHAEYLRYADVEGALALVSGWMGEDLSRHDLDQPLGTVSSNAIHTYAAAFSGTRDDGRPWTVRDLGERAAIGGLGSLVVGSGQEVADQVEDLVEQTGVDGFNLAYVVTPGSFVDVVEHVVPVLQERGRYPTAYEPGTLRHKLLGAGDRHSEPVSRVGQPA